MESGGPTPPPPLHKMGVLATTMTKLVIPSFCPVACGLANDRREVGRDGAPQEVRFGSEATSCQLLDKVVSQIADQRLTHERNALNAHLLKC